MGIWVYTQELFITAINVGALDMLEAKNGLSVLPVSCQEPGSWHTLIKVRATHCIEWGSEHHYLLGPSMLNTIRCQTRIQPEKSCCMKPRSHGCSVHSDEAKKQQQKSHIKQLKHEERLTQLSWFSPCRSSAVAASCFAKGKFSCKKPNLTQRL